MWARGVSTIKSLREHNGELRLPFDPRFGEQIPPTAWTSVEYQFAATDGLPRRDDRDSVHGVRAITSLGSYDSQHTYAGDVVFHGSKFVAPFPSGSTFIFPAWWMPYSFTLVDRDETHYVIMQHMDAGLDRFVQNGFQSDAEYEGCAASRQKEAVDARAASKDNQLDEILGLFSKVEEFPSAVSS
ncbi:hypothetical protein B0H11DRAFT_1699416 [Mycena galericulata]|nr:hypothetical protein B0H11DRAFT_1699416 [Mycena galericulata]